MSEPLCPPAQAPTDRPRPAGTTPANPTGTAPAGTAPAALPATVVPWSAPATAGDPLAGLLVAVHTLLARHGGRWAATLGLRRGGVTTPVALDLAPHLSFSEAVRRTAALLQTLPQPRPDRPIQPDAGQPDAGQPTPPAVHVVVELADGPPGETDTIEHDLVVRAVRQDGDRYDGRLIHPIALVTPDTAVRLAARLSTLCTAAAASPDVPLRRLALFPPAEREMLLAPPRDATPPVPDTPLVAMVAASALATPDAIAVESGADRLTYAQLMARADALAVRLRAVGVRRGDLVAVAMPRGVDLVAALLGVHRCGAAYLPLDPDHPAERLAYVLAHSGAAVLVTRGDGAPVPADTVIDVDTLPAVDTPPPAAEPAGTATAEPAGTAAAEPAGAAEPATAEPAGAAGTDTSLPDAPAPDDAAYVIYTSGSTGRPKGVLVSQRALTNFIWSMRERPGLAPGAALPAVTTVSFDIAALELFLPLVVGGRVVVADRAEARDPELLAALLSKMDARVLQATPATWRLLLDSGWTPPADFTALCGGEKLPADLARRLVGLGVRLWDLYGPTETTIWSSVSRISPHGGEPTVSDFAPVANTTLYVLDDMLEPVPAGCRGELFIGGTGVALGYLGRSRLTADRFVPDPYGPTPGGRLYRTGDVARRLTDGTVEILGRTDDQVKIRGFRVEPAEIEDALTRHPGVRAAVVRAFPEPEGGVRLVGYLLPADPSAVPSTADLHAHCQPLLPAYMIPARFVPVDAFPTTPNGKLDRAALPAPADTDPPAPGDTEAPRTPVERAVADVLAQALDRPWIGRHDDFFLLGGHSLAATRAIGRLRAALRVDLPVAALFQARTVAGLAELITDADDQVASIPAAPGDGPVPLSFAQRRMWLLHRLDPDRPTYLEPLAVPLPGPLDGRRLDAVVSDLFARHDILRTRYPVGADGEPVQVVEPPAPIRLTAEPGRPTEVLAQELTRPFDLTAAPPVRVRLLRDGQGGHTVVLVVHHIAVDDRSLEVIAAELTDGYAGRAVTPPPLRYADYTLWQRDRMSGEPLHAELTFWRDRLAGLEVTELLTDRPRPATWDPRGGTVRFTVDAALAGRLAQLGSRQGATPFVTLLAGFLALVGRYTGRTDVAVGVPVSGRDRAELDDVVGLFVNTMVLRADLSGPASFPDLITAVGREVVRAYPHAQVPFDLVVAELGAERDLSRNPLFGLLFALHETVPPAGSQVPDLPMAKFDIGLHLTRCADGGLAGRIEYPVALFDEATIAGFADHYVRVLAALVADPATAPATVTARATAAQSITAQSVTARAIAAARVPATGAALTRPLAADPAGVTVAGMVASRAARTTGVAVTGPDGTLTYPELDRAANRLAHRLRELGAGPDRFVVVRMPRTPDLIVALLAVLRSGAAYIPVDPDHPVTRLRQALDDSGATIVVTPAAALPDLPAGVHGLAPDDPAEADRLRRLPATAPDVTLAPDDLAYVVYTSGSTGRPKGAMVTHGGLANYTRWAVTHLWNVGGDGHGAGAGAGHGAGDGERHGGGAPLHTSLAYDLALTSLYPTLAAGATVDLIPAEAAGVEPLARSLAARAGRQPYGVVKLTPTHLDLLREALPADALAPAARCLVIGGEELRGEQLAAWAAHAPATRVVNSYGPSEAAIACSVHTAPAGELDPGPVPIGRPLPGTAVHLLDGALDEVPDGAAGEIHVGGVGVGRGYLGDPRLTADRFVPDPHSDRPGARLYRTGDLARRRPDGGIVFLGRRDHQVKIRGFRVELGEVEAVLAAHPGVRAAAVTVDRRDPGNPRLAAYVVPAGADVPQLRSYLARQLPGHQVPTLWGTLPQLPLLGNGKLDRAALPALTAQPAAGPEAEPATPAEQAIAQVWTAVLGVDRVGRHDRFFDLGGQSVLATRVVTRLSERFPVPISVRDVFAAQTVAELADLIATRMRAQMEALFGGPTAPAAERGAAEGATELAAAEGAAEPKAAERGVAEPAATVVAEPPARFNPPPPIPVADRNRPLPLSPAQRRLWFLDQLNPGSTEYLVLTALRIRGRLDVAALSAALTGIVRRHEVLRTRYLPGPRPDDEPVQVVDDPPDRLALVVEQADPAAVLARELDTPIDLATGPVVRVRLVAAGPEDHLLAIVIHHIATDGWSTGVLARELAAGYRGVDPPAPAVQYADFAAWQLDRLTGPARDAQLGYWRERLAGLEPTELPTDRPRGPRRDPRGDVERFTIPAGVAERLSELGNRAGATAFMVCLAGYLAVLGRYAGRTDVAVGVPVSGRHRAEFDDLIGFFVNTVVLRADLGGQPSFHTFVERVRDAAATAYLHDELPFEHLVEDLAPQRDLATNPLVRLLFAYREEGGERFALPGLTVTEEPVPSRTAKFDVTCELTRRADGSLTGEIEYATALFDRATVARLARHYVRLLTEAADRPRVPLRALELMDPAERAVATGGTDAPVQPWPPGGLPELIAQRAAATPDRLAVDSPAGQLTFAQVDDAANRLARHLRAMGIGRDDVVGVCLARRPRLVVTVLGVQRAGAAFLPLDPRHPVERSALMLTDSRAKLLLVDDAATPLADAAPCAVLDLDAAAGQIDRADQAGTDGGPLPTDPDALAYVIFTSGSTGRPKGVGVPHRGIRNRVLWAVRRFGLGPDDRMLQKTSVTFDASVWELLGPLAWGGTVVLPPDGVERDPAAMAAEVARQRVTVLQGVPSFFRLLVEEPGLADCTSLRLVFSAGEALPTELARRLAQRVPATVVNTYGPTECSIDVTSWSFDPATAGPESTVPIGRPIDNTRAVIFSPDGSVAPLGVPGELCVAGEGLARGYLGQPRLTAQRFVPDPYGPPGSRAYRTGDLVRRTARGVLEFRGRADDQVKIRGVRAEPGEVEAALAGHPAVTAAAVVARPGPDGQLRLVAYLVPREEPPAPREVRDFLLGRLPEPYVPSVFVTLDRLPVTASGKVDRRALPDPGTADQHVGAVAPRTPAERVVAGVLAEVLAVTSIGATDDFFELGGHSLLAVRIAGRLRAALRAPFTVRTVFEARTVAGLARWAEEHGPPEAAGTASPAGEPGTASPAGETSPVGETSAVGADGILRRRPRTEPIPLSFAQQRIWFLDLLHPDRPDYHVVWAHRLTGHLDTAALTGALGDLVARHEALRTRYVTAPDGQPGQVVEPATPVRPELIDISAEAAPEERLTGLLRELADRRFDLSARPPVAPYLVRIGPADHALVLVIHHIAVDAWSERILARDLAAAYRARLAGTPAGPAPAPIGHTGTPPAPIGHAGTPPAPIDYAGTPPAPIDYADFAAWQRSHLTGEVRDRELRHWRERLAGLSPLDLPTDRPRPPVRDGRGATVTFDLPDDVARPLVALGRARGATAFMTFLAVFTTLLARYTGGHDLAVGTPAAGRGRPELEEIVGFFVNTLVLRLDLAGDPSATALIDRVRDTALEAFGHDELPFDVLVEDLAPQRDLSRSPLVDVIFEVRPAPDQALRLPALTSRRLAAARTTAKFDLALTLTGQPGGGYRGELEYSTALFDEATVDRLAGHFRVLAAAMAGEPDRPVRRLPLLTETERADLLDFGGAPLPNVAESMPDAIAGQVAQRPDATAVIGTSQRLTFAELSERANVLAGRLRTAGVRPDRAVAVFLDRSPEVFVVLLAVWRAGGAFVALDTAHPPDRLAMLLADLDPVVVLTDRRLRSRLPGTPVPVLAHDEGAATEPTAPGPAPQFPTVDPESAAYLIYTSGSTGQPKAVVISHASLAHHCRVIALAYGIRPGDRGVLMAPLTFDLAMEQMAVPLVAGAATVVCEERFWPPAELPDRFAEHGVRHVLLTPAYYREVLATIRPGDPRLSSLRTMAVGADVVTRDDARRWLQTGLPGQFVNGYGPTEATIASVTYAVPEWDVHGAPPETAVPIGRPVPGTRAYVLDPSGAPVPVGVAGELCLGGVRVARGYLGRPRQTADRFVPDPFGEPGARLYRTGDQARWRRDGVLEFLGRLDGQVKIRGYRIELGEVEAALAGHPSVRAAAVSVHTGQDGERRLAGYVVPVPGGLADLGQLREHLRGRLPEYMVPAALTALPQLPMTPSGKVDRRALPAPAEEDWTGYGNAAADAANPDGGPGPDGQPRTEVEKAIAEIWAEVLGRPAVGVHDQFFDIGGHSLLATRVLVRLRDLFELDIPLRTLFEATTVSGQAAALERLAEAEALAEAEHAGPTEHADPTRPDDPARPGDRPATAKAVSHHDRGE